jgi:hypothetical protein
LNLSEAKLYWEIRLAPSSQDIRKTGVVILGSQSDGRQKMKMKGPTSMRGYDHRKEIEMSRKKKPESYSGTGTSKLEMDRATRS